MRSVGLVGLALLTACGAPEVQSQRLKDGSWSFTCELPMDECVRRAQEKCELQRYRILEGSSETRLRDAPPFERAYHTSRLTFMCTNGASEALVTLGSDDKSVAAKSSAAKAVPATSNVCTKGETRACVGPAACKGGQACLTDGSGFGACDCGPATPVAPPMQVAPPAPSIESTPPEEPH